MGKVRITSTRVVRAGGVLYQGDEIDGSDEVLQSLVRAGSAEWADGRAEPEKQEAEKPKAKPKRKRAPKKGA